MNTYYEILGLEPGASQLDIKKAYFKMVRQHSPESDPEQFQKIREAYEQLKQGGEAEKPVFPPCSDTFAAKMLEQIENCRRAGDNERFRDTCEEAWRLFPNDIQFLYLLVIAQRQCGNTGKAVKNAELLVGKEPTNKWFQRELAISYTERGFSQKAYHAYEKAYELGCRDTDFILMYAMECNDYGQYDRGIQILLELIRQDKKWSKDEIPELMEAHLCLLKMDYYGLTTHFTEIIDGLCMILQKYRPFIAEYIPEFAMMLFHACADCCNGTVEYQKVHKTFSIMREMCHTDSDRECVDYAKKEFIYQRIMNDTRIGETLKQGYAAYYDELDPVISKFALTDTHLCMIEEHTEILEQAEIIRQEYPDYYDKLQDFIQKLKSEKNLIYLKDSLQKDYRRMEPYISGGVYYKKYPLEKRKSHGTQISEAVSEEPYVRGTKKIGRNEPCPCGSGKKYKHCCMNK